MPATILSASVALNGAVSRFVAGVAALGVLGLGLLPPEHVHLAHAHDDHHATLDHRHFAAHQPGAGHSASIGDHDDDDDEALWLDSSFIGAKPAPHVRPMAQAHRHDAPAIGPQLRRVGLVLLARPSIHDPPLRTSPGLRAPPSLSV
jgi:hypothetical protein